MGTGDSTPTADVNGFMALPSLIDKRYSLKKMCLRHGEPYGTLAKLVNHDPKIANRFCRRLGLGKIKCHRRWTDAEFKEMVNLMGHRGKLA